MARYTSLLTVAVPLDRLRQVLFDLLAACNCRIIYDAEDYVVAREIPGGVAFAKLVTVEVLIEKPESALVEPSPASASENPVRMSFVVKNEELPLKTDNHCYQMFHLVNRAIAENHNWSLIESVVG